MKTTYHLKGMKCQGCVNTVTDKLSAVMGVKAVEVDLEKGQVTITGTPIKFLLSHALKGTKFQLGAKVVE